MRLLELELRFMLWHPIHEIIHILSVSKNGKEKKNLIQLVKPKRKPMVRKTNVLVRMTRVK